MIDEEKIKLKVQLKEKALDILNHRIDHAYAAMNEAQHAANDEDKNTVGDKHNTGRAMAQNDRDIYARQLEQAKKEQSFVQQIDVKLFCNKVVTGAIVETTGEKYFILAGLGIIDTEIGKLFYISLSSPLGQAMQQKKAGESFEFHGKKVDIKDVF